MKIQIPPTIAQVIRDTLFRKCKRCGAKWLLRPKLSKDGLSIILEEPGRCAKKQCKSKYWNKDYVRGRKK